MASSPSPTGRVVINEATIQAFRSRFPILDRLHVLHAIVTSGPWRVDVEAELQRRAAEVAEELRRRAPFATGWKPPAPELRTRASS